MCPTCIRGHSEDAPAPGEPKPPLRLPLCFSLMAMAVYPALLCPVGCLLRRMVIDRYEIRTEGLCKTCAVNALCFPCALWQTRQEAFLALGGAGAPAAPPPAAAAVAPAARGGRQTRRMTKGAAKAAAGFTMVPIQEEI